ncbi:MAG: hypothetical protein OEY43_06810 [Gammaproteobacteria bacterium]|nr:hypothetical protein [Gammaproteobacteria bacterium]
MATQIADAVLHIDEELEKWQRDVLDDHMRLQRGVLTSGSINDNPHIMFIQYYPEHTEAVNLIRMVNRHGYHAARIS